MQLPTSVLNDCNSSFKAADEKREKASTTFFADTGIMALICRHDRLLFAANMTHAGERQHYALALFFKLLSQIPSDMTVGLLYIFMIKFGFLKEFFPRIIFAVSVFHAYGHQWACQVIYHPRKCAGFGLSDGEGCERFWSSIKKLIPTLRVSGYYQRLFTLDLYTKHLEHNSRLQNHTSRPAHHCQKCQTMKATAWRGAQAVKAIMALDATIISEREEVSRLQGLTKDGAADVIAAFDALGSARAYLNGLMARREKHFAALGIAESASLLRLKQSKFLQHRMNALAVKHRMRDKLRQRKFENERLERAYRRTINESKHKKHIAGAMARREPTVQKLSQKYNELCRSMAHLIATGQAPQGAVAPEIIPPGGLWKLDVDDTIWQDIGLDEDEYDGKPPLWLRDEKVRSGIRNMLDHDRCIEEEQALFRERVGLQDWLVEEWHVVKAASDATGML
ncbi:hypothetical protein FIBSPDRAFT_911217 [Athelia psychrophila]|uniref:CxC1-like cysteine cluster associated with KDZ transposases domain-containing protein n=1 Tax=Athelia psychrophila TaxID=1759441 RepID=A0A166IKA1_9AGAM|nr:hypothetical protein FIBSPDRAFT_911217 [Fibularhizoctonia sp. CBS 109695]